MLIVIFKFAGPFQPWKQLLSIQLQINSKHEKTAKISEECEIAQDHNMELLVFLSFSLFVDVMD